MITLAELTEQLELCDQLLHGRERMFEPRDLPGNYGRAVQAVERILQMSKCSAVLAGGWAVWRHGFVGRVTQDIDIVLPADRMDEFFRIAAVSGFEILEQKPGRWPKLLHKASGVKVDILPEGATPGNSSKPAPTTIPHPDRLGGSSEELRYISKPGLFQLKLAAGRSRDETDAIELIRTNMDSVDLIRKHLQSIHADYAATFERLLERAIEQRDE